MGRLWGLRQARKHAPYGLDGGEAGTPGRNVLVTPDGTERALGGKASTGVEAGTIMRVETPGGGYGRPEHS